MNLKTNWSEKPIVFMILNEHLINFSVISQIDSILCSSEITVFV